MQVTKVDKTNFIICNYNVYPRYQIEKADCGGQNLAGVRCKSQDNEEGLRTLDDISKVRLVGPFQYEGIFFLSIPEISHLSSEAYV